MLKLNAMEAICLRLGIFAMFMLAAEFGRAQTAVPNGDFENGKQWPTGWRIERGIGAWENEGHSGQKSISLQGDTVAWPVWISDAFQLGSNKTYLLSMWIKAVEGSLGMIVATSQTEWEFRVEHREWQRYQFFFETAEGMPATSLRLASWRYRGKLLVDNIRLVEAKPVYLLRDGVELGEGERIKDNSYTASGRGGPGTRFLAKGEKGQFRGDRWYVHSEGVIFRHRVGELSQTEASFRFEVGWLPRGKIVVLASNDGKKFSELCEVKKLYWTDRIVLPASLFPAKDVYIWFRCVEAPDDKPYGEITFELTGYEYKGKLATAVQDMTGKTDFVEVAARPNQSRENASAKGKLVCRGVEETGQSLLGDPSFGPHLLSLFVTGRNPLAGSQSVKEHVAWVNHPLHSYVADGTGALCVWAHPSPSLAEVEKIMEVPGLTGVEVSYRGDGVTRDELWDRLLSRCYDANRPFLYGFAADDTHSLTDIDKAWFAALVETVDSFSLKKALRSGAFYISNGPRIDEIRVEGATVTLRLPLECDVLWLRAGQFLARDAPEGYPIGPMIGKNHCLKHDKGVRCSTIRLAEWADCSEFKYIRGIVRKDANGVAATQPWRLNQDRNLANPYPERGVWIRGQTHNHTDTPPGVASGLPAFREAYRKRGQEASFATDYSYWETPMQCLSEDGTPQIEALSQSSIVAGTEARVVVTGQNFAPGARCQIGGCRDDPNLDVACCYLATNKVEVVLPGSIAPGIYDLSITNPDRLRGTHAQAIRIREKRPVGEWCNFTPADGLVCARSICVACVENAVWVGSPLGVSVFGDQRWTTLKRGGLPSSPFVAYSILNSPAGDIWISTGNGMIRRDAQGKWKSEMIGQCDRLSKAPPWIKEDPERWGRMAIDQTGILWLASLAGAGLGMRQANRWERLLAEELPCVPQTSVACDSTGTVWLGTQNGLYQRIREKWQQVKLPIKLETPHICAIAPGLNGETWCAVTEAFRPDAGGVVCFRGSEASVYLPTQGKLPSARIWDILVAKNGKVWFASDFGLTCLSPAQGSWVTLNSINSDLLCDSVRALAEDQNGSLWCATAQGVSCLRHL